MEEEGGSASLFVVARHGAGSHCPPPGQTDASHEGENLLEGEFSALSIEKKSVTAHGGGGIVAMLTANTLNNEVLPAFWRPIIVISISVALSIICTR